MHVHVVVVASTGNTYFHMSCLDYMYLYTVNLLEYMYHMYKDEKEGNREVKEL